MIACKFLPSQYAEQAVERGRFRISLLSYFHTIELAEIRDDREGISRGTLAPVRLQGAAPETAKLRDRLQRHGFIKMDDTSSVIIGSGNVFTYRAPPMYVLSLSTNSHCKKWLTGEDKKDAIISVTCVRHVGVMLAKKHGDLLGQPTFGRVRYRQPEYDLGEEDLPTPDPFSKRPEFSSEEEFRIIFPAKRWDQNSFLSECPEISQFLTWRMRE